MIFGAVITAGISNAFHKEFHKQMVEDNIDEIMINVMEKAHNKEESQGDIGRSHKLIQLKIQKA